MEEKKSRQEGIEELTLALLYLTRFPDREGFRLNGSSFREIAWKNYSFDAIEQLDSKGCIIDPRGRHRSKYAYLTEKGRQKARQLLRQLDVEDTQLYERFEFRTIRQEEAEEAAEIEAVCFPPNEACSREHMLDRVKAAPELFLVAIDRINGRMAGFLNGVATNESRFRDDFFTNASLHDPQGTTVMLLGLDVLPEYRGQGLARELVFNYCRKEQEKGRLGLVLTCLAQKVKMYTKLGFRDLGEAESNWGGEKWHEMSIALNYEVPDDLRE